MVAWTHTKSEEQSRKKKKNTANHWVYLIFDKANDNCGVLISIALKMNPKCRIDTYFKIVKKTEFEKLFFKQDLLLNVSKI